MASPHTAGVAALIVSQFGSTNGQGERLDGLPTRSPRSSSRPPSISARSVLDKCFGKGRIDALRAVRNQTSYLYDNTAPACTE